MNEKYFIVTGLRRSGTSMLMGALRECGIPVAGFRFPLRFRVEGERAIDAGTMDAGIMRTKNQEGYWEMSEVIRRGLNKLDLGGKLVKVPCGSLLCSNPILIEKALFITRDPRKIVTSMKRDIACSLTEEELYIMITGHSILSVKWLKEKKIPYKMVDYASLLEEPEKQLERLCKWLGRGNYLWGMRYIDRKYDRSQPDSLNSPHAKIALEVHTLLKKHDLTSLEGIDLAPYKEILDKIQDEHRRQMA